MFKQTSLVLSIITTIGITVIPTTTFAHSNPDQKQHLIKPTPQHQPKIQLAILLDTSGSMDGLIDQTRNQLWQVVNEFSTAKRHGITPKLEVALFEYGNDGNSRDTGFVRMLNNFTQELDKVSEGLFSLTTNGGSEFCGFAIKTAVHSLNWSHNNHDIKTIFIAGNEPFSQGPVNYRDSLRLASQHGIAVNTIHAGDHQVGIDTGWQNGALLAGGDYMSIDSNRRAVHVLAPQDKRIVELNAQLNETYIPYGQQGKKKALRQKEQDSRSESISSSLLSKRAITKSSSYYKNSKWDLIDALEEGEITEEQVANMDEAMLPKEMKDMTAKKKKQYISEKTKKRTKLKQEIKGLSEARKAYVAEMKKKQVESAPSMSDALTAAIKKQAAKKEYQLEE